MDVADQSVVSFECEVLSGRTAAITSRRQKTMIQIRSRPATYRNPHSKTETADVGAQGSSEQRQSLKLCGKNQALFFHRTNVELTWDRFPDKPSSRPLTNHRDRRSLLMRLVVLTDQRLTQDLRSGRFGF
jgi:hypothetical protein